MARRMLLTAIALVACSWSVLAVAHNLILTSGEHKISGNVIYTRNRAKT